MRRFTAVALAGSATALSAAHSPARAQVTLAQNKKTAFTLILPANAPKSLKNAAGELSTSLRLSTGVHLATQQDSAEVKGPFISLGSTRQAASAGFKTAGLADEAFRIVTRNGNLYILGPDTADGGWTKGNGVSNGTAHGVYTFLEDYLGVRWLMPGDLGRDVPARTSLSLPAIDKTVTPRFKWRHVTHLWDHATESQMSHIVAWSDRQKLGGATYLDYDHNMWRAINDSPWNDDVNTPAVKAIYAAHPEWFAMDAFGQRPYPKDEYAKLETTNQDLVKWFAAKAVSTMKNNKRPVTFSLSPSDGNRWSQSPESKALYDPPPSTLYDPELAAGEAGVSSLVLKYYHDIAEIVARDYPEGRLTGYIYAQYVFPPTKVQMKLPDNFMPVICGIGTYGYMLYRPENQKRYRWVMDSWARVAPADWFYYDLPNQLMRQHVDEIGDGNFPGTTGIVAPAAPGILDIVYSTLVRNKLKGAYIYGVPSWSSGAMSNYLLAKLNWDPTLKADALQQEWLTRAYGPAAAAVMEQFYKQLDGELATYFRKHNETSYHVTSDMLRDFYAVQYPALEKLLLKAQSQKMTPVQQQRLQLIEINMAVLQWRLRNAGFLPSSFVSPLQKSDEQVNELLTRDNQAFAYFPGADGSPVRNWEAQVGLPFKVQLSDTPIQANTDTPANLGDSKFLIYPTQSGDLRINVKSAKHATYFAAYQLREQNGQLVQGGILRAGSVIRFAAKANTAYSMHIPGRKGVTFQLEVPGAALANGNLAEGVLNLSGAPASTYVYYGPQTSPVGAWQEEGAVVIRKPFLGSVAADVMGDGYNNIRVLQSLDDGWLFSPDPKNDGLQRGVLNPDFDDASWKPISTYDWWQSQGFPDYRGPAWYRLKFNANNYPRTDNVRLYFGAIDGNATIYLNRQKIMEHKLGPDYKGWDRPMSNDVTWEVKPGENILVVQVTSKNETTASGIFKGAALIAGTRKSQ